MSSRRLVQAVLIAGLCGTAEAAVFCVDDALELAAVLDTADDNGQSDVVELVQGVYAGSFVYLANAAESGDLALLGGYTAGCASRTPDPANTVLDGGGARVLRVSGRDNSNFTLEGVTIRNGSALADASGLDVDRMRTVVLASDRFVANVTPAGADGAGGVHVDRTDTVEIRASVFEGNRGGDGGALSLDEPRVARLEANDFLANEATAGGGAIDATTAGELILVNNVLAGNLSAEDGGALDIKLIEGPGEAAGRLVLTNNTLAFNAAGEIGGALDLKMIGDATRAELHGNALWSNTAPVRARDLALDNDDEQNGVPSALTVRANDFDQRPGVGYFAAIPIALEPGNLDRVDPLFLGAAADDYRLQAGSALIDAGDDAAPALPLTDRAGAARLIGAGVDIGAFEFQADDADGDGVADAADNCTLAANADQRDTNGDGYGNACDADLDDSGTVDFLDLAGIKAVFFQTGDLDADLDGDGAVGFFDLGIMKAGFFGPPGPSGVTQ